jgi:excisionase family DNA binding protein
MSAKRYSEPPLKRTLRDCDPDGFVSMADLRHILRCSRSKIDRMTREGKLQKIYIGSNVRIRVQQVLQLIEDATGERPDPWGHGDARHDQNHPGQSYGESDVKTSQP